MARFNEGPAPLGESLRRFAMRYRKIDLDAIGAIRERWSGVVGEALATRCEPTSVRDGVLMVKVASGAVAQKILSEEVRIIAAYEDLGEHAPRAVRTVVA